MTRTVPVRVDPMARWRLPFAPRGARGLRASLPAMARYRRLLCPVDFSDVSRRAAALAAAVARRYGAELDLLHVVTGSAAPPVGRHPAAFSIPREPYWSDLRRLAAAAVGGEPRPRLDVVEGAAGGMIVDRAAVRGADLVVMGTHGRTGLSGLVMGSVAEDVLRHAPCPVLVVPPRDDGRSVAGFRRVLCPVDFSATSRAALEHAMALAAEAAGVLTVLHVRGEVPGPWAEDDLRSELRALVPDALRTRCEVREVVDQGSVTERLLHHAGEADLVALGAHGRGPVDVLLFGSVTRETIRHAPCPVLTVRPEIRAR
jgi:nucleotide-binding universal stress UspA family protein